MIGDMKSQDERIKLQLIEYQDIKTKNLLE
jgi:hypothetical protein